MTTVISPRANARSLVVTGVLFGLVMALAAAPPVRAAAPEEVVPSATVSYSDLNLGSEEGVHALYARILAAARKVCDRHDADALETLAVPYCVKQTIARAVQAAGSPRLAALHAAQGGHG
jgi:UrcA family protein